MHGYEHGKDAVNIFNLGADEYCEVSQSVSWICQEMQLSPKIELTGGDRGWVGDNPYIYLDTKKIRNLGWSSKISIEDAVVQTVRYLKNNEWLLNKR